jgi:hypothetical protein
MSWRRKRGNTRRYLARLEEESVNYEMLQKKKVIEDIKK